MTAEQLRALGGGGATRTLAAQQAYQDLMQQQRADPTLSAFQKARAGQLATRDLSQQQDAIGKEAEAAIQTALQEELKRKYEAQLANAGLTAQDLAAIAAIFYGAKGDKSAELLERLELRQLAVVRAHLRTGRLSDVIRHEGRRRPTTAVERPVALCPARPAAGRGSTFDMLDQLTRSPEQRAAAARAANLPAVTEVKSGGGFPVAGAPAQAATRRPPGSARLPCSVCSISR